MKMKLSRECFPMSPDVVQMLSERDMACWQSREGSVSNSML